MRSMPMVFRVILFLALAAAVLNLFSGRTTPKGEPFSFAAETLEGEPVTEIDGRFDGKILVVDIWGSWCPPCRAAIPHLNVLSSAYADRGVEVVGIAFEESPSREVAVPRLRDFMREFDVQFTVLYGGQASGADVRRVFPDLGSFGGFPTTIVLDRERRVQEVTVGFSPELMTKIERAVEASL
jgi:thiol-disulfide isomerase/thioredoxin